MKLKTVVLACSACLMAYYIATEYAKEPKTQQKNAFATAGLWQRQEFMRRLLEDARKKARLPDIKPTKGQNLAK